MGKLQEIDDYCGTVSFMRHRTTTNMVQSVGSQLVSLEHNGKTLEFQIINISARLQISY